MNINTLGLKGVKIGLKMPSANTIAAVIVAVGVMAGSAVPHAINADFEKPSELKQPEIIQNGKLTICKLDRSSYEVVKTVKMLITAYSSSPDETDDTPFITASGKHVADGIIANNLLSFGTKIRIPELYGDKVFVVEDRMHQRKGKYMADVWMGSKQEAKNFGAQLTLIEILDS